LLDGITPRTADIPLHSTLTGELIDGTTMTADHWYQNLRHQVRFATTIENLAHTGHRTFIEISAHPVLTMPIGDILDQHADTPWTTTGTLRRNDDTPHRFLTNAAELHVRGTTPDWTTLLTPPTTTPDLPTYPFQRTRYWLERGEGTGDVSAAGLDAAEHPLLGAVVELPDDSGVLVTGLLSLRTHPWLADHAVSGTVLVPGAALVEMAVGAADRTGAERLDELVLEAPLVLPASGALRVQVAVGGLDELGRRPVTIHTRAEDAASWTRHATGFAAAAEARRAAAHDFTQWPPRGAEALSVADFYDLRFVAGYEYGPVFQGLERVWRRGEELFAEVALPDEAAAEASAYGLHPALLDAALHTAAFGSAPRGGDSRTLLPFAWNGVTLHAAGAARLRVRIAPGAGDAVSVEVADSAGAPVATVESLALRAIDPAQLSAGDDPLRDALFRVEWQTIPTPDTTTGT
ncbi:polyketide synthase dehydratase domain-containing protein, partial [Streptomyces zhihengii]